jgi:hypothetical protein
MRSDPLQNLGMMAAYQHDSVSAQSYLSHALELNEKAYGENSPGVATSLRMMATVYSVENDFAKAEPFLLPRGENRPNALRSLWCRSSTDSDVTVQHLRSFG